MSFWYWLNKNSAALQALASLLSFAVAAVTVPVLTRTMRVAREAAEAAKEQARAANAQVVSANESSRLSELQVLASQDSAKAEREHSSLIRQQMLASLQPVLIIVVRVGQHFASYVIENQADAIAFDVIARNGTPNEPRSPLDLGQQVIAARGETFVQGIDFGPYENNGYTKPAPIYVRYRSQDGRSFITQVENLHIRPLTQEITEVER